MINQLVCGMSLNYSQTWKHEFYFFKQTTASNQKKRNKKNQLTDFVKDKTRTNKVKKEKKEKYIYICYRNYTQCYEHIKHRTNS